MQGFFEALVRRRWLVMVLALAVVAGGWLNLRQLAIDAVPDISPKQVMVLTEATGLGPLEVERLVSFPVETAMTGLPEDLPRIGASLRAASDNAAAAFASLRGVLDGARVPVQSFAGDTLPQITRLSQDMRTLVQNMDQLVSTLRRNPAQLLSGPRTPEFRR